jgi:hypothetical protein
MDASFLSIVCVFDYGDRDAIPRVDPTARYSGEVPSLFRTLSSRNPLRHRDNAGSHPVAESMGIVYDVFANIG